ncbi:MAG: hypothetical protein LBN07_04375 [Christensenellaceae bacterium]|nr:hypothetical protein [Christensenellaceae bacterium]
MGSVASGRVGIELYRSSYLADPIGTNYTTWDVANALKIFDGRLYVQTITSSLLNNGMEFDVYINVYIYGEAAPRVYVHHIVVRNIALVDLVAAGPTVLSEGGNDRVDINIVTAGQLSPSDVSIAGVKVEGLSMINDSGLTPTEVADLNFNKFISGNNSDWILRNLRVYKSGGQIVLEHMLDINGNNVFYNYSDSRYDALQSDNPLKIVNRGAKITITVSAVVIENGQEYSREKSISINVVDVVIVKQSNGQYVSVDGIGVDGALTLSVDSSMQLRAMFEERVDDSRKPNIFGSIAAIDKFSLAVSRTIDNGATSSWLAKRNDTSGNYVTLNDNQIMQTLPFEVNVRYTTQDNSMAVVSLIGSNVGSNALRLQFSYGYINGSIVLLIDRGSGSYQIIDAGGDFNGAIAQYDPISGKYNVTAQKMQGDTPIEITGTVENILQITRDFTVNVIISTDEDAPQPIFTEQDLRSMQSGGSYILMNNIVIESHTPLNVAIFSLDGNNKIITIKNFNLNGLPASNVQLGLFGTVQSVTVLKNIIVALPNDKRNSMVLDDHDDIKIGGIAGINQGIINNCDVITISETDRYLQNGDENPEFYSGTDYSLNVHTSVQINNSWTRALLGGLVGLNDTTGIITNSRVGRDEVGIVMVNDAIGTEYSMTKLASVVPATVLKLEGTGVVGGFVGRNDGVISSSYFKNGQIINISYSSISYGTEDIRIASAGFAGINNGAVYGSYAAGFEEEDYLDGSGKFMFDNVGSNTNNLRNEFNEDRKLGGGIFSNGNVAGFVYQNTGHIGDSYSNINLSGDTTFALIRFDILQSTQLMEYGNIIAGGFVYINGTPSSGLQGAYITTSYSLSNLKHNITTHGAFTGVSGIGDVQNYGTIEKCYYLNGVNDNYYDDNEPADKVNKQEGVEIDAAVAEEVENIGTNEFILPDSFAGFSFDVQEYNTDDSTVSGGGINLSGVWSMFKIGLGDTGYPELVSANYIATSVRIERNNLSGGNYSYLYVQGFETGSANNPYLIYSAQQYNRLFDIIYQTSPTVQDEVMAKFVGNVRLAGEIDFAGLDAQPSSRLFEYVSRLQDRSVFDGNNMPIRNVTINSTNINMTNVPPSVGLFGALNGVGVKNLTISIDRVTASNSRTVGGLAGIVVDSYVSNINLVAATELPSGGSGDPVGITGYNFAGSLAGIVVSSNNTGGYYMKNINSNVAVNASRITSSQNSVIKTGNIWEIIRPQVINGVTNSNLNLRDLPDVSYAGGIVGVIDLKQYIDPETREQQEENDISLSLSEVNAKALHVGDVRIGFGANNFRPNQSAIIVGEYAGGVAGFVGEETYLQDGFFQIKTDSRIRVATAGGGIAGINYGLLDQVYVSPDKSELKSLDANTKALTSLGTSNTFNKELFWSSNGSGINLRLGGITGINIVGETFLGSGSITDSLSRADVRNQSALSVGGIAGATYGGRFVNVYTTGGLLANVSLPSATIGGIVGEILQADNNNPYIVSITAEKREVTFAAAVAMNFYLIEDFAALRTFTQNVSTIQNHGGYVDYGDYSHPTNPGTNSIAVNVALSETQTRSERTIYDLYDGHGYRDSLSENPSGRSLARIGALFGLSTHYQKDIDVCVSDGEFNFSSMYIYNKYKDNVVANRIRLFMGIDAGHGGSQSGTGTNKKNVNIISTQDMINLFDISDSGLEPKEKEDIFPKGTWSERIWKYDSEYALPYLKYGYMPAVEYIYTPEDFQRVFKTPSAKKIYYVMADLDFSVLSDTRYIIDSNFRGQIIGVTQYIQKNNKLLGRNPILFNLVLNNTPVANHALFQRATNAVFRNLDFVVREYYDDFPITRGGQIPPLATTSAVVAAIATNTTFSNINIYGKLTTDVTKNYLHTYTMTGSTRNEHYFVVTTNDPVFTSADVASGTPLDQEKIGESKYREVNVIKNGAVVDVDVNTGNITANTGTWNGSDTKVGYALATYSRDGNGNIIPGSWTDKGILKTGAKSFGALVANGFNVTINGCSATFNEIRVELTSNQVEADQAVMIGGLGGNVSGTVKPFIKEVNGTEVTFETSFRGDITFSARNLENNQAGGAARPGNMGDIRELDVGGVFGKFNGRASGLSYKSRLNGIKVGNETTGVLYRNKGAGAENSKNEFYVAVGGLIGSTEIPKNSIVSDFSVSDSSIDVSNGGNIEAYVNFAATNQNGQSLQGDLSLGGIVGINGIHLSSTSFVQALPYQSVIAGIRSAGFVWNGNISDPRPTTNVVYIGGVAGRSSGRIEGVNTSARIEVRDLNENSGVTRDNRVYAGGIVGQASTITINNVIAHGQEIAINCGGTTDLSAVFAGGILGYTTASSQISMYNAVSAYDINVAKDADTNVLSEYQKQRNVVVGGVIGWAVTLQMANALNLGDIYVGTLLTYEAFAGSGLNVVNDGKTSEVTIGGLIGVITQEYRTYAQGKNNIAALQKTKDKGSVSAAKITYAGLTTVQAQATTVTSGGTKYELPWTRLNVGGAVGKIHDQSDTKENLEKILTDIKCDLYFADEVTNIYSNDYGNAITDIKYSGKQGGPKEDAIIISTAFGVSATNSSIPQYALGYLISNILLDIDTMNTTSMPYVPSVLRNMLSEIFAGNNGTNTTHYTKLFESFNGVLKSGGLSYTNFDGQQDGSRYNPNNFPALLNFYSGGKFMPIKITGNDTECLTMLSSMQSGKYYILTRDIIASSTLSISPGGWYLNANTYTIKVAQDIDGRNTQPVFNAIPAGATIVGLLLDNVNITTGNAPLAITNNGTLFKCGVTGDVSGSNTAGLVETNNGRILSSFSRVNMMSSGVSASGIAVSNSGEIIASFSTSTMHTSNGSVKFAGIALNNVGTGMISNCYTDSNMINEGDMSGANTYAIANWADGAIFNSAYDRNAFVGNILERKPDGNMLITGVVSSYMVGGENGTWTRNSYATNEYITTIPQLTANFTDANKILTGGFTVPNYAYKMYEYTYDATNQTSGAYKSTESGSNTEDVIYVDDSWFNSGYGMIDMFRLMYSQEAKVKLLQMIYTGNGNEPKAMSETDPWNGGVLRETNHFEDGPYQITNIGVFELFMSRDTKDGVSKKSWYILKNDISALAYDEWSPVFNGEVDVFGNSTSGNSSNPAAFYGDFNGNNKKVLNLQSQFGLFRIIVSANVSDFSRNKFYSNNPIIYDLIIKDSVSKTGMVAGYMGKGAEIINVRLEDCGVINGSIIYVDQNGVSQSDNYTLSGVSQIYGPRVNGGLAAEPQLGIGTSAVTIGYTAGAFVGYMTGGSIVDCDISTFGMTVRARDYAGGFVGRIVIRQDDYAPIISLQNGTFVTGDVTVIAHTAGGIAGQANKFAIGAGADEGGTYVKAYVTQSLKNFGVSNSVMPGGFNANGWYNNALRYQYDTMTTNFVLDITAVSDFMKGFDLDSNITVAGFADHTKEELGLNLNKGLGLNTIAQGGLIGEVSDKDNEKDTPTLHTNTLINIKGKTANPTSQAGNSVVNVTFGTTVENNIATRVAYSGGVIGNSLAPALTTQEIDLEPSKPVRLKISNVTNNSSVEQESVIIVMTNGQPDTSKQVSAVYYGGIVGYMPYGEIKDVRNNGWLVARSNTSQKLFVGGVVGMMVDGSIIISSSNFETVGGAAAELGGRDGYGGPAGSVGGVVGQIMKGSILGQSTGVQIKNYSQIKYANYGGGIVGYATVPEGYGGVESPTHIKYAENAGDFEGNIICMGGVVGGIRLNVDIGYLNNSGNITSMLPNPGADAYAGGIIGYVYQDAAYNILDCKNMGDVKHSATTTAYAGGIAGYIWGRTTGLESEVKIVVSRSNNENAVIGNIAGGIIGSGVGIIDLTGSNTGDIGNVNGNTNTMTAGGIIGQFINGKLNIFNADNKNNIVSGQENAGGIIGKIINGGSVNIDLRSNVINDSASIVSGNGNAGGVVGWIASSAGEVTIERGTSGQPVITRGTVQGSESAGGFIGKLERSMLIESITNEGSVTVDSSGGSAGGIVGYAQGIYSGDVYSIIIRNPINKGNIIGGNSGGIAGYIRNVRIEVTSGTVNVAGVEIRGGNGGSSGGIVGLLASGEIAGSGTINVYGNVGSLASNGPRSSGGIVGKIEPADQGRVINITNFQFVGQYVEAYLYAGGVVGYVEANGKPSATINISGTNGSGTSVESIGSVNEHAAAGGIVGFAQGGSTPINIYNSNNYGQVTSPTAGGIVGMAMNTNIDGINGGSGSVVGATNAGGILGAPDGSGVNIARGGSSGLVSGSNAGGVIGNTQTPARSTNYTIAVGNSFVANGNTITGSIIEVSGTITGGNAGGFAGRNNASHTMNADIEICKSDGTIGDSNSGNVGGAIGWAQGISGGLLSHLKVGKVTLNGKTSIGGYVGHLESGGMSADGSLSGMITFANGLTGNVGGYVGNVKASGTINNLKGLQINVFSTTTAKTFGGIVGNFESGGTVSNCDSSEGGSPFELNIEYKGGIVGKFGSAITISNCTNNISIRSAVGAVGGFVAKTTSTVTFSGTNTNNGNISRTADGSGEKMAGGFVGDATAVSMNSGTHTNSGQVTVNANGSGASNIALAGGFAGRYSGTNGLSGFKNTNAVTATCVLYKSGTPTYISLTELMDRGYAAAGGIIGELKSNVTISGTNSGTIQVSKGSGYAWYRGTTWDYYENTYWWTTDKIYITNGYAIHLQGYFIGYCNNSINYNSVTRYFGKYSIATDSYGGFSFIVAVGIAQDAGTADDAKQLMESRVDGGTYTPTEANGASHGDTASYADHTYSWTSFIRPNNEII